MSSLHGEQPI